MSEVITSGLYITVLTAQTPVGKTFYISGANGSAKVEVQNNAYKDGYAYTVPCNNLSDLALIRNQLNPEQCLLLGYVPGTQDIGGYRLLSEWVLKQSLGLDESASRPMGLMKTVEGHYVAGRFKGNFVPSPFFLLDRDIDSKMPESLCDANYDAWWHRLSMEIPVFAGAARLIIPSSKSRVAYSNNGEPVYGDVSSHTYLQMTDPQDYFRFTEAIVRRALAGDVLGYDRRSMVKVRGRGEVERSVRRAVFDVSVFQAERVIYEGAPAVLGEGLRIIDPTSTLTEGGLVMTSVYKDDSDDAGIGSYSVGKGNGGSVAGHETGLFWQQEVETANGVFTIREVFDSGLLHGGGKVRCQTPYRDSQSWNGVLRLTVDGEPCLHDNGLQTTFHLDPLERVEFMFGEPMEGEGELEGVAQVNTTIGSQDTIKITNTAPPLDTSVINGAVVESVIVGNAGVMPLNGGEVIEHTPAMQLEVLADNCESMEGLANTGEGRNLEKEVLRKAALVLAQNRGVALQGEMDNLFRVLKHHTRTGVAPLKANFKVILANVKRDLKEREIALQGEQGDMVNSLVGVTAAVPSLPMVIEQDSYPHVYPDVDVKANGITGEVTATPQQTGDNLRTVLDRTGVSIWYNQMTRAIEIYDGGRYGYEGKSLNTAYSQIKDGAVRNGMNKFGVDEMLDAMAGDNQYHPFKNYLEPGSVPVVWDGVDRIDAIVNVVPTSEPEHFKLVLRRWMISAVAAVYGYPEMLPPRGVLVFSGKQYARKTSFFHALSPPGMFKKGVRLDLGTPKEVDSISKATKAMITELGELDQTFKQSAIAALKAFLDLFEDEYRMPYARHLESHPRMTVFCATVNHTEFLKDDTGNSRYWVIEINGSIDTKGVLGVGIQQLWAQMKAEYDAWDQTGYDAPWLLTKEEMVQLESMNEVYRDKSIAEEKLEEGFQWDSEEWGKYHKIDIFGWSREEIGSVVTFLTTAEVSEYLGFDGHNQAHQRMMLKALKWMTGEGAPKPSRRNDRGKLMRGWRLPKKTAGYHNGKILF